MKLRIEPSVPCGNIQPPPSKSIAHRMILCAALSNGKSTIKNIALSDDISATLSCIKALGADFLYQDGVLTINGIDTDSLNFNGVPDCRESGSTLRFILPLCMLVPGNTVLRGKASLLCRPLNVYETICNERGIFFEKANGVVCVGGTLSAGEFSVRGDVSSQFISGLLFALPLLRDDSRIILTGKVESRPYIDITIDIQNRYGVNVYWLNENTIIIPGGQKYVTCDTVNESDWSNAAFMYAMKACGFPIDIADMDNDSLQGDKVCVQNFERLKNGYDTLDVADCPDLAPILFAFAAMHHGGCFTGSKRLRFKESDRVGTMAEELAKFGVKTVVEDDRVIILPCELHAPYGVLHGHNDHRIVMSLAVMCVKFGGIIEGTEAVNKSYPVFFNDLERLKVKIIYEAG